MLSAGSLVAVVALAVVLSGCHGFFVNPTLQSITISPSSPSVVKGQTVQLTASGVNTDGSTTNHLPNLTWSSGSTGVATVNSNGLVTGVTAGTATITATSGSVSGTATVTVTNSAIVSIAITPTTAQISVSGIGGATTQQFTAKATFADNTVQDITNSATWTSSNTAAATISANGLAQAVAAGTTTITASAGNITSNQATLTVVQ
jgi:trimeric autotransporter adhesin